MHLLYHFHWVNFEDTSTLVGARKKSSLWRKKRMILALLNLLVKPHTRPYPTHKQCACLQFPPAPGVSSLFAVQALLLLHFMSHFIKQKQNAFFSCFLPMRRRSELEYYMRKTARVCKNKQADGILCEACIVSIQNVTSAVLIF